MEEVYLTVKELAELKGCTERYIRSQITKEKICVIQKNRFIYRSGRYGIQNTCWTIVNKVDTKKRIKKKKLNFK